MLHKVQDSLIGVARNHNVGRLSSVWRIACLALADIEADTCIVKIGL